MTLSARATRSAYRCSPPTEVKSTCSPWHGREWSGVVGGEDDRQPVAPHRVDGGGRTPDPEVERQWWKYAGAKEQAVREQFDMSATRYYQVLNALIDRPEALEVDPLLVRRLRRLRAARQRQRSARRLGFEV